jgi:hypothetical protein
VFDYSSSNYLFLVYFQQFTDSAEVPCTREPAKVGINNEGKALRVKTKIEYCRNCPMNN